jgi:FkbM family methyltransferase
MGLSGAAGRLELRMPVGAGHTHGATFAGSGNRKPNAGRGEPGPADGFTSEMVDVTTLDAYFAGRSRGPDFIKIDVEGHELAVLAGGRSILETHHPLLLIECEARHRPDGDVRPVLELLCGLGYVGSFFHERRRRALREFRPAEHQPAVARGCRPPRGYVNNFVFEHGARG